MKKKKQLNIYTAVIMTPTRELALQIHRECNKFARKNNLKSCCVYGGTGISEQVSSIFNIFFINIVKT